MLMGLNSICVEEVLCEKPTFYFENFPTVGLKGLLLVVVLFLHLVFHHLLLLLLLIIICV